MYGLRILLADADPMFRRTLKDKLINTGYLIVGEAGDARTALNMAFNSQPDLVIIDFDLPGQDVLEIAGTIEEHRLAPVLFLSSYNHQDFLKDALKGWFFSYLVKPVEDIQLIATIEVAVATFRRIIKLEEENRKLREMLELRKLMDRAKGLLADVQGMTEREAYKFLQKLSMDKGQPLKRVIKQVIKNLENKK